LPKLNSGTIKKTFELSTDYVISKFYELGYKVSYNKYNNTYNSCCPLCKEGKSWGRKKRCFYIPENNNIFCHNCGESLKPYNWIRKVSGMSDEEIKNDVGNNQISIELNFDIPKLKQKIQSLPDDCINLSDLNQLEFYKKDHIVETALSYLKGRRLDTAINKPSSFFISLKDYTHKNRLVIPFLNTSGKFIHYQSRRLFEWDEKPNYLSKFNSDKSIFGIERVDSTLDDVFIFEGPLDACFVRNGVAVAGINEGHHKFTPIQLEQLEELKFFKKIWVLDNQWIDKASRLKTLVLLEQGECVFIWPEKFKKFKDINELCVYCGLDEIKHEFIKKNSTCGKGAIVKFKVLFGKL
jgi:hypothetical protein